MCFKRHSAGPFNKYSNCVLSQWHGHLFTVTSSHSLLSSLHRFTVYSRRGSFLRRLFIFYYWRNVRSSQPTPSECQAAPRVWCTAAPRRPRRQPGLNTPQGQTSKTHKACSINYSEWRRLSVADKCVLRFYSCSSLQFQLQGWKKRKKNGARSSINMHFIPTNGQKKQKNKCTSLKTEWQQIQRAVREGARERDWKSCVSIHLWMVHGRQTTL